MKKLLITLIMVITVALVFCGIGFAVSAETETPTVSIDSFNLTFESDTYIKYAVKFDGIDDASITRDNTGMLYWTAPQTSYEIGSESSSSSIIGWTESIPGHVGEKYYTFAYDSFAAKQMTDYVYSVAYIVIDGEYFYSEPVKYSILTYAYDMLGYTSEGTSNEALKNMLTSLLNYGASAQTYYNYKTDRLANGTYYEIIANGAKLSDGFSSGLFLEGESVTMTATETDADGNLFSAFVGSDDKVITSELSATVTVGSENTEYTAVYGTSGLAYKKLSDGTYSVSGYTGSATDVVIPPIIYDGAVVSEVGVNAFRSNTAITSVRMYDGINILQGSAFYGCSGLLSAKIPDGVTSMGSYAFYNCSSLTSIEIPGGVTSIGESAFYNCVNLESVEMPNSVTNIGGAAFYHCRSLAKINIPDSITNIGYDMFLGCSSLADIIIPSGVTQIGSGAFRECDSLKTITIPNGVTVIGWYAFQDCDNLKSILIPDSVLELKAFAFSGCRSLEYIGFSANSKLSTIEYAVFRDCTSLTDIRIPDGVTIIEGYAFAGCSELYSITIPKSLASIYDAAFQDCKNIRKVYISDIESWCNIYFHTSHSNPLQNGADLLINGILLTDVIVPNTVTKIGNNAFYGCNSIKSLVIPSNVKSIGSFAFQNCVNLVNVTTSSGLTEIDQSAFENCSGLKTINIPDSVTTIDTRAFKNCVEITSIILPYNVKSIGNEAFSGCSNLVKINIPDGVTSIGYQTFYNCSNLSSVEIGTNSKITSIGNDTFRGCGGLTSITIPANVTSIGTIAFSGCNKLVEVINCSSLDIVEGNSNYGYVAYYAKEVHGGASKIVNKDGYLFYTYDGVNYLLGYAGEDTELILPESYNDKNYEIYKYAFSNCVKLKSVTIPSSINSIPEWAFKDCSNLTMVIIENGVKIIDDYALYNCDSLTSIIIPDSVTSIGEYALYNCNSLKNVTIPSSVTSLGRYAFYSFSGVTSVIFEKTEGWWRSSSASATSGTTIPAADLAEPATAAKHLSSIYYNYYWKCTK